MTPKTSCDIAGAIFMFAGGALLTWDALTTRKRTKRDRGAEVLNEILEGDNPLKDLSGRPLEDHRNLDRWLSRGPLKRTWIGFLLTTLGFLLDLVAKLLP
jgi:hypothetical protein